jgi:hypothetical protein
MVTTLVIGDRENEEEEKNSMIFLNEPFTKGEPTKSDVDFAKV